MDVRARPDIICAFLFLWDPNLTVKCTELFSSANGFANLLCSHYCMCSDQRSLKKKKNFSVNLTRQRVIKLIKFCTKV